MPSSCDITHNSEQTATLPGLFDAAVKASPDRPFLWYKGNEWTYRQADLEVRKVEWAMDQAGVQFGTPVILFMHNRPEFLWSVLAAARRGAVSVPLNIEIFGQQLTYYIEDAGSAHAIVGRNLRERFIDAVPVEHRMTYVQVSPEIKLDDSRSDGAGPDHRSGRTAVRMRDVAFLMYTSGTTGRSKAAIVPHAQVAAVAEIMADTFGITQADRLYNCMPLYHANALWYTMATAIKARACFALGERFSLSNFWDEVRASRATEFHAVGSMVQLLEASVKPEVERENDVRIAFTVPLPSDPAAYEERIGARLSTVYALTEWLPAALTRPGEHYHDPSKTNRDLVAGPVVASHSLLRLVDEDDADVPPGEVGEIVLRSQRPWTTFLGYHNNPRATADGFRNLWFHTGDFGRFDEDGCLYFCGRKKDAIRRRGENISAFEVEEILRCSQLVTDAAAVALPSELTEDEVCVFVVRAGPASEADIHRYATEAMPRFMVPRYVVLVDELPCTPTGKVEKYRLIAEAQDRMEKLWDAERVAKESSR